MTPADSPSAVTGERMPASARSTSSAHTTFGRCLYAVLWVFMRTVGVAVFGVRYRFAEPLPPRGGLIVLSSHQSHLDPLLLGLAADRRLSSLARSSLYRFRPFGFMIAALGAVPIDRNASMVTAMKTVIRRLEGGAAVIIFPEGTRTATGRLGEMKSGFALLAKRAGVTIVPVAIVGAFECWPRSRVLPRPGRVRLEFGRLLRPEAIQAMDERTLRETCARMIAELDATARAIRDPHRSRAGDTAIVEPTPVSDPE
jgi:1-acyl-sn-glycerol-3-phosphate acyltransferase